MYPMNAGQPSYKETQSSSDSRSEEKLIELFKKGEGICAETAEMALKYFKRNPVIQDGDRCVSNISLATVKQLYESLPDDGKKLIEIAALLSSIILHATHSDSDSGNEFVQYLFDIVTADIDKGFPEASIAFADYVIEIHSLLKDEHNVFMHYFNKVADELNNGICEFTYAEALYKSGPFQQKSEAYKYMMLAIERGNYRAQSRLIDFKWDDPALVIPDELHAQCNYYVSEDYMRPQSPKQTKLRIVVYQYNVGLTYLHAYNKSGLAEDLAAAINSFRCCIDQGQDFVHALNESGDTFSDLERESVVTSISYSAYALLKLKSLEECKNFVFPESKELSKWFVNVPEIKMKRSFEAHLRERKVLSMDEMRNITSKLLPLFIDPNSLFSALDKYQKPPEIVARKCAEFQMGVSFYDHGMSDACKNNPTERAIYFFQAAAYGYLDAHQELEKIFSPDHEPVTLTPELAKHAAAYFDKYPNRPTQHEFKILFEQLEEAIENNQIEVSKPYVDLACWGSH